MEVSTALIRLAEIQKLIHAYSHAGGVLNYDAVTVAPEKSAAGRGETLSVLVSNVYELACGEELKGILDFLSENSEKLTAEQKREVELLKDNYDRTACIPKEEYIEYTKLSNEADAVWHKAKPENDFAAFAPYLEKLIDYTRRFALYYKPDNDPYETMLDEYEKGVTQKQLDEFFGMLREKLVPIIHKISAAPAIDDSFLHGEFPIEKQRELSDELMRVLCVDCSRCSIGETLHPFTTEFNVNDVRITTNYKSDNFSDSMYSVIHESGHALYELGGNPAYDGTVLSGGTSLGVHESQSRFFENIVGRSEGFCAYLLPIVSRIFPSLKDVSAEDFYRAINISKPSLIRTAADELTYPLHIMIRYELEKKLISGELKVANLPAAWNAMYKEYLGVDVPDDEHGCLQDSHWAGGSFGYFPSYALGSAYAAQYAAVMKDEVDISDCARRGELAPVVEWLRKNIHQYSSLYDAADIVKMACRGEFDPQYYVNYLIEKFSKVYRLDA